METSKNVSRELGKNGGLLPLVTIIVGAVIALAAFVLYGAWSRKKIYRRIDELESWKIDIMNRPVTDELAKVKRLKMNGEAEAKFETWRAEWDDIITVELPNIEEKLFDAEEASDKYRFRSAGDILSKTERMLHRVEERISGILRDLEELISSERQNREEIVDLENRYQEARKHLLTNRRLFQKALVPIEEKLEDIGGRLTSFDSLNEEGNYLEARDVLLAAKERLDTLQVTMERVPALFSELQSTLPEEIKELRDGCREMIDQGYVLDHLMVDEELEGLEKRIEALISDVEKAETEHPREAIRDIRERIDMVYDQLEGEVASRQYVKTESPSVKNELDETEKEITKLKDETELVQLSYRIEQEDLDMQEQLEKETVRLKKKFRETEAAIREQKQAFSTLQDQLDRLKAELKTLEEKRESYKSMLRTLRQDELEAKETLVTLRKRIMEAKRKVQKSNIPGIPHEHLTYLEAAEEKIAAVDEKLNEKPLEMTIVNQILSEALEEVDASFEHTNKMIEDAALAERLIQYGNRYRSRYPSVQADLAAAEASFRNYHYEEALELAATAVEKVEPDILKKFEVSFEEEVQ